MVTLEAVGGSWKRTDDPGEPQTGKPRVSIAAEEAIILAAFAHGRTVLEIGTGLGVSTRAIATTAEHVATVDIDTWVHDTIWPELPDNVTTLTAPPGDVDDDTFDMVFIDGDHATEAVRRDIDTALRVAPSGLLVAHDAHADNVRYALDDRWHVINTEHGLGVCWGVPSPMPEWPSGTRRG